MHRRTVLLADPDLHQSSSGDMSAGRASRLSPSKAAGAAGDATGHQLVVSGVVLHLGFETLFESIQVELLCSTTGRQSYVLTRVLMFLREDIAPDRLGCR